MSSALEKFKANRAAAPAQPTAGKGRKGKNRWAGVKSAQDRDPFPWTGEYIFRVDAVTILTEQGESYRATLEVIEVGPPPNATPEGTPGQPQTKAGDRVVFLQKLDGDSWRAGGPQVKRFTKAVVGIETDEEFDALDPEGKLIDAGSGELSDEFPENPLVGRFVAGTVTRGKEVPESGGDFYRQFKWAPLPEEIQTELAAAYAAKA